MRWPHFAASVRDLVFRMFPHRTSTGLRAVGDPGPESPVAVTGNFALTVSRLEAALRGLDVWVLVVNSRGINVWCAAAGGHLTHHDVIAAVRTSDLAARVRHRRLILPQLAATGVERRRVEEATGFRAVWGPASLEDLPGMLRRGGVRRRDRLVRFPLRDRLEMACVWALPMAAVGAAVLSAAGGAALAALAAAGVPAMVAAVFAGIPRLPVVGPRRWWTFGGVAGAGALAGALALGAVGAGSSGHLLAWVATCLAAMALLSVDVAGTTPLVPSSANTLAGTARIDLAAERCTGAAECVQVCPKGVLEMNGRARRVEIRLPGACIACGACVVQCPEDALRFRFPDGRTVEAATIRSTRTDLLGRRTVRVPGDAGSPARSSGGVARRAGAVAGPRQPSPEPFLPPAPRRESIDGASRQGAAEGLVSPGRRQGGDVMGFALSDLTVTSPAFSQGGAIPSRHTGEGEDVSPPLAWSRVPEGTRSFAVICHDPDAPLVSGGTYGFVHWVLYNIPGSVTSLEEGTKEHTEGRNDFGKPGYGGPMPPNGHGVHRYYFWVLALDRELGLEPGLTLWQLLERIEPHLLGMNRLVGTYERK